MYTISQKTIEKLDKRFGGKWMRKSVVEALGGNWPLSGGWQEELIGNKVDIDIDSLVKAADDHFEAIFPKVESKRSRKRKAKKTEVPQPVRSDCNVVLTDEQQAAVNGLAGLSKKVQSLGGLAGTGKTTLVSVLLQRLKGFACCAFTGKAAEVLRSKGVDATTIHSLIYIPIDEKNELGDPLFELRPRLECRGIIVDEASMVGRDIYNDLVSFNLPVVFIGDHGQLEPVGEDIYLMQNPDYRLETIHRNAGPIAKFAHHLRSGGDAKDFEATDEIKVMAKPFCSPYLLEADQIICAFNNTRVAMNKYIRQMKGFPAERPVEDDRIISLRNSRKFRIYNGTQGRINSLNDRTLAFQVSDRRVRCPYDVKTFNAEKPERNNVRIHPFDYAYSVTCHKAQGSEWDKVLVYEQKCSKWDHKRWAYTAASRAKKQLFWVTS